MVLAKIAVMCEDVSDRNSILQNNGNANK